MHIVQYIQEKNSELTPIPWAALWPLTRYNSPAPSAAFSSWDSHEVTLAVIAQILPLFQSSESVSALMAVTMSLKRG